MRRFHNSQSHLLRPDRPMTEARRQHIHGRIRPMDDDRLPLAGILRSPAWRAILLALAAFWAGLAWLAWSWIDG